MGPREVRARAGRRGVRASSRGLGRGVRPRVGRGGTEGGGLMRWDQPWWLLLLLIVPVLAWRARRPAARRAAVLWVRSEGPWAAGLSVLPFRVLAALPWIALVLALVALARPQQGLKQTETDSKGVD